MHLSMSIVTVQLGQCGNQIGFEVFDALYSDSHCPQGLCSKRENEVYQASCKERFFSEEENGGMCGQSIHRPLLFSDITNLFKAKSSMWYVNPISFHDFAVSTLCLC